MKTIMNTLRFIRSWVRFFLFTKVAQARPAPQKRSSVLSPKSLNSHPAHKVQSYVLSGKSICVWAIAGSLQLTVSASLYLAPDLPEADLTSPAVTYQGLLDTNEYDNLLDLIANPGRDTDGDGYTDLQEYLTGADSADDTSDPEKFNLALAMAVDWTRDVDPADSVLDLLARWRQTSENPSAVLPEYLEYLSPTLETQFRRELAELATELDYDPVKIYQWVYKNVEFEDYELSRKGALATYRTGRGNEYDQCSLLIVLLRMSGIPARYVVGPKYESVPTLPDQISLKDAVFVQVWLPAMGDRLALQNPLDSGQHTWITLAPWYKTLEISEGIDLFHQWNDSNGNGQVEADELSVSIPSDLEVTRDYLLATSQVRGSVSYEIWTGIGGTSVSNLTNASKFPYKPDGKSELPSFEAPSGQGSNYGSRIRGFLYPQISGEYTFWITSDDQSQLWLSADSDLKNKVQIVSANVSTGQSQPVQLKAGERYYIEALHKEGGGNDYLKVEWKARDSDSNEIVIAREVIPGRNLSPYQINAELNPNAFDAHEQLTAVEFFEKELQSYLSRNYENVSIKDVPFTESIVATPSGVLPRALPTELAKHLSVENITVQSIGDVSELTATSSESARAYAELEIWKAPKAISLFLGSGPPILGYWTGNAFNTKTFSTATDSTNKVWDAMGMGELQAGPSGRIGGCFALNLDSQDDTINVTNDYLKIADNGGSSSHFGHQAFVNRTISMWINVAEGGTSGTRVLYEEGGGSNGITIRIKNGELQTRVKANNSVVAETSTSYGEEYENEWHHITIIAAGQGTPVFQGAGVLQIYVDGTLIFPFNLGSTYTVQSHGDGGAIGARHSKDVYGNTATGDFFAGLIDEVLVVNAIASQNIINILLGKKLIDYTSEQAVFLTQVSDRRLVLDFIESSGPEWELQTKLDGLLLNSPTGTFTELRDYDDFEIFYRPETFEQWTLRPSIRRASLLSVSFDALSASDAGVQYYVDQLKQRSGEDAISADLAIRESYLGHAAALMAENFSLRTAKAERRAERLLGLKSLHRDDQRNLVLIWTYPGASDGITAAQLAEESAIGIAAGWNIDAVSWRVPKYPLRYPVTSYSAQDELADYLVFLESGTASYNEALVFEDWQGTPSLSTVAGFFEALQETDNQVIEFEGEEDADSVADTLSLSESNEMLMTLYLQNGATVWTTEKAPTIRYPDSHPNAGDAAVQSEVSYVETNSSDRWSYGPFNGGQSYEEIDEEARIDIAEVIAPDVSFTGTHPLLIDQATEIGATDDYIQACLDEQVARDIFVGGDPVDLVTGEFFLQEPADISVRSRGFDLSIARKYKSQVIYDGPLGYGWTWNHGENLVFASDPENGASIIFYDGERRPICIVDNGGTFAVPEGITFTVTQDTNNDYLITYKTGRQMRFAADGLLLEKRDRYGNTLSYSYDGSGRMTAITDSLGRSLTLDYTDAANPNKVTSVTDFTGRSVNYTYNAEGDLVTFTDLADNPYEYSYLSNQENPLNNHNLSRQELPSGDYLDLHYYKNDTVSHHTSSDGRTFHFQYSWLNRYTETWTEEGHYQKIFYNNRWDVTRIQTQDNTLEFREYDIAHNMTALVDGNGNRMEYRYDDQRNMLSYVNLMDPATPNDDIIWAYEYEPDFNRRTVEINPLGVVSEFEYDAQGNMLEAKAAVSRVNLSLDADNVPQYDLASPIENFDYPERGDIYYTYDPYGNRIRQVQFLQAPADDLTEDQYIQTDYIYDVNGLHLTRIIDPRGYETQLFYDDLGRQVAITDPLGHTTQVEYNLYDAPVREVSPDGAVTISTYDENRRITATTNAIGAVSQTVYGNKFYIDHIDRVLEEIDPLGYRVQHSYDDAGNRIQSIDRNGNITRFAYDEENRLIETIDALGNSVRQRYDGNGNVITHTDARGNTVEFSYDRANRLIERIEPWGDERTARIEYDALGRKITDIIGHMEDGSFVELYRTAYEYDARDHVIKTIENAGAPLEEQRTLEVAYDSLGRVNEQTESGLRRTRFSYDANDNLEETTVEFYVGSEWTLVQETTAEYDPRNQLSIAYDPKGQPTLFEYDAAGRELAQTRKVTDAATGELLPHTSRSYYDILGRLVRTESSVGDTLIGFSDTAYNLRNERVTHTDALGHTTSFGYDPKGNRTETTDPAGFTAFTYYDGLNRVIAAENALGQVSAVEYDANGNTIATVTSLGHRSTFIYNENNERTHSSDPLGNTTEQIYDERGRVVETIDARGNSSFTTYTAFNEIETVSAPVTLADGSSQTVLTTNFYDRLGTIYETVDPKNRVTQYKRDGLDRVVYLTQALGTADEVVTYYDYDANGNRTLAIEAFGTDDAVITQTRYDELDRAIRVDLGVGEAEPLITRTRHHDAERKVVTIDPYGMATTAEYDILGRLITQTDAAGHASTFEYDSRGNLLKQTFPADSPDAPLEYAYDALNRRKSTTQDSETSHTGYDADGRVEQTIDFRGYVTRNDYDAAARLIRTTRAVGTTDEAVEKMLYDANGNLLKIIDANNVNTAFVEVRPSEVALITYTYDELNRQYKQTDPDNNYREILFDATGQAAIATLRDGTEVKRTYDDLDRVEQVEVKLSGASSFILEQEFDYDKRSRMTKSTDYNRGTQTHSVEYQYDFASRVTLEEAYDQATRPSNSNQIRSVVCEYNHIATGDLSQEMAYTYPSGKQFTTQLDRRGQIAQIDETTNVTSKTLTGYLYDPVGRQNTFTLFDDNTALLTGSLSFNNRGWEDERVYQKISGPELYRADDVLYDPNGNIRDEDISGTVVQAAHIGAREYINDPLNRMTDQTTPALDLEWDYDLVGNWKQTNQNGTSETRGVNDENEYVSVNSSTSWTDYDDRGNLIEWGSQDYLYDWANRLIEVRNAGSTVANYTYDAANRRVSKYVNATGITTTYAYKGAQVFEEYENGTLARSFVYGEYIDAPIALYDEATSETYYYLRDRRANIIALVNDTGTPVESYEYTAFGTQTIYDDTGAIVANSQFSNPYGFTGRRYDAYTGLWYYRNRMYSDVIGRFLQRDPAGFVDGSNLYAYVTNNPMRWVDPMGLNAILYQSMNPGISAEMGESGVRTAQIVAESIVNSAPYQNTSLMVDYIARDDTSFITDSRLVMGIGFSYLSGDIFDVQDPVHFGSNTISVNGIQTGVEGRIKILRNVNSAFGVSNTNAVVNDSHWLFGIGDFIQIAGEELGAITIPSVRAAEIARTMGPGELDWIAHSQGTSVSRGAFALLPFEITSRINFQGFGGQSYIDAADYGLNSSRNAYMPGDFVPSLSPRNWGARFFGSGGYEALPSNGTARDLFGFIPTTIRPHLWSESGGYNAYINGPNNPLGEINTGVNSFGNPSSFAPFLYEPTTPTFIWDNPTPVWEMNLYGLNGLLDTVSPDPFGTFNSFDTFDPGFGNPFGPSIIDPWSYSPFNGSNISDPFGSSGFDTGFSDPFGYDPFSSLNGGQSAPFIDRSRLVHRNSQAVHGRSVFTGRANVPRPRSLSTRLFK